MIEFALGVIVTLVAEFLALFILAARNVKK